LKEDTEHAIVLLRDAFRRYIRYELPLLRMNKCSRNAGTLLQIRWVRRFITFMTVANVLSLSVDWYGISEDLLDRMEVVNLFFIIFFIVELVLNVIAQGLLYFYDTLNVVDGLVIVLSAVELMLGAGTTLSVFRVFRIGRVALLVRSFPTLRMLLRIAVAPLRWAIYLFGMLFVLIFIVGSLAQSELNDILPKSSMGRYNFETIPWSGVAVFQSLDIWGEIITSVVSKGEHQPLVVTIVFLLFVLIYVWFTTMILAITVHQLANGDKRFVQETLLRSAAQQIIADSHVLLQFQVLHPTSKAMSKSLVSKSLPFEPEESLQKPKDGEGHENDQFLASQLEAAGIAALDEEGGDDEDGGDGNSEHTLREDEYESQAYTGSRLHGPTAHLFQNFAIDQFEPDPDMVALMREAIQQTREKEKIETQTARATFKHQIEGVQLIPEKVCNCAKNDRFRNLCIVTVHSKAYQIFVICCIFFSSFVLLFESSEMSRDISSMLVYMDVAFALVFASDIVVRLLAVGFKRFFSCLTILLSLTSLLCASRSLQWQFLLLRQSVRFGLFVLLLCCPETFEAGIYCLLCGACYPNWFCSFSF